MIQNKENLKLGYKTDIGAFTYINAEYGVDIEDYVEVGSHCSIYSIWGSTVVGQRPVLTDRLSWDYGKIK